MIPQYFAYLILPIFIYSVWDYVRLIIKGKVSPKIISWGLWSFSNAIAVIVALGKNSAFMDVFSPIVAAIGCSSVAVFALTRKNKSLEISKLDWFCICLAFIGIGLSLILKDPLWALVFAILADISACIPTFVNCFQNPEKEGFITWCLALLSKFIGLAVVVNYNVYTLAFQIVGTINNLVILFPLVIFAIFKFKFFETKPSK